MDYDAGTAAGMISFVLIVTRGALVSPEGWILQREEEVSRRAEAGVLSTYFVLETQPSGAGA